MNTLRGVSTFLLALCTTPGCMGLTSDGSLTPVAGTAVAAAGAPTGASAVSALQAFQNTFYGFARANCAQCHGLTQAPLFAVSDATAAYGAAAVPAYIDFSAPAQSVFVVNAGNGHCGLPACTGSTQSAAALAAVNAWATAELAAQQSPSQAPGPTPTPSTSAIQYTTAPMALPSPLPGAGNAYGIMRWNLSGLTPAATAATGAIFEVGVQLLTAQTYIVANPKLAVPSTSAPLAIKGVHVLLNGVEQPLAMEWASVNQVVPTSVIPTPLPKTTLTTATLLSSDVMPLAVGTLGTDKISIGFESFVANPACKNLNGQNGFVSNVLPQMQSLCFSCHLSGPNAAAYAAFPMTNPQNTAAQASLCAATLQYIDLSDPQQSQIITMPASLNNPAFNATPFIDWIETE